MLIYYHQTATCNLGHWFFRFYVCDIQTTRNPRLGKGNIVFRQTNNNINNKETLSSGIVLRIGPELSRSRHMTLTALPTYPNLSQIKRHVDFNQYYITKETRLLTTEFPIRTFTLLPLIFHPGSSVLSSILMSLLLLDTNIPASGVSSLFPLSSSS